MPWSIVYPHVPYKVVPFSTKKVYFGSTSKEGAILVPPHKKRDHFYRETGKIVPIWHSGTIFMKKWQVGAVLQNGSTFDNYGGSIFTFFVVETDPQESQKLMAPLFKKRYCFQPFF